MVAVTNAMAFLAGFSGVEIQELMLEVMASRFTAKNICWGEKWDGFLFTQDEQACPATLMMHETQKIKVQAHGLGTIVALENEKGRWEVELPALNGTEEPRRLALKPGNLRLVKAVPLGDPKGPRGPSFGGLNVLVANDRPKEGRLAWSSAPPCSSRRFSWSRRRAMALRYRQRLAATLEVSSKYRGSIKQSMVAMVFKREGLDDACSSCDEGEQPSTSAAAAYASGRQYKRAAPGAYDDEEESVAVIEG
eukprot:s89_g19.t1